jgi:PAS domain S-box-containing protein
MGNGYGDISKASFLTVDEIGQSVVITDPSLPDNPMIFISEEFEHQTGYSPDEALGRNCRFLQGPDTSQEAVEAIRAAIRAQTPITIDILNYRKNGARFWNRLRIRPLYDASGNITYLVGAQNPVPAAERRPEAIDNIVE